MMVMINIRVGKSNKCYGRFWMVNTVTKTGIFLKVIENHQSDDRLVIEQPLVEPVNTLR